MIWMSSDWIRVGCWDGIGVVTVTLAALVVVAVVDRDRAEVSRSSDPDVGSLPLLPGHAGRRVDQSYRSSLFCSAFENVDREVEGSDDEVAGVEITPCFLPCFLEKNLSRITSNLRVLEDELVDIIDEESSWLVVSVSRYLGMLLRLPHARGSERRAECGFTKPWTWDWGFMMNNIIASRCRNRQKISAEISLSLKMNLCLFFCSLFIYHGKQWLLYKVQLELIIAGVLLTRRQRRRRHVIRTKSLMRTSRLCNCGESCRTRSRLGNVLPNSNLTYILHAH
ncbi:hypothetical protein F5Y14DRAFT_199569 [Nemania sp. NC0429]|nr:hypothetical protein F5Y14DRAFT_199569 [Nemania sp. NC0429]